MNQFRRLTHKTLASLVLLSLSMSWHAIHAQSTDTHTLIVPYPAGGAADALGRMIGDELGKELGARVVVDNKPGGAGIIGLESTVRGAPARTMLLGTNSHLVNVIAMFDKLPLNVEKDVKVVAMLGYQSQLLVARRDAPYNTVSEFLAYARANPGKVNRGSVGPGSIGNISFVRFELQQNIQTTHIPYKGDAPALTDLLGGSLDIYVGGGTAIRQNIAGGKLKGIAVMGPQRFADIPTVPTLRDSGIQEADAIAWYSIAVPSNMPADAAQRLSQAANKVTSNPAVVARMKEMGVDAFTLGQEEATSYVAKDRQTWVPLIRRLGIKAD